MIKCIWSLLTLCALCVAFPVLAASGCGREPNPSLGDTWTRPTDAAVMVYIPAGEFEMGSDDDGMNHALQLYDEYGPSCSRKDFEREQPAHTVALDGFWIDRVKVTNAQFSAFLNEQGNQAESGPTWLDLKEGDCLIEQSGEEFGPKSGYADHPMMEVSWYGADAYCKWVGARLPTEAEWEYTARGPEGRAYPWGNETPTCELAQFLGCSPGGTVPVGSFPAGASWCGAQDLTGNVWEWVADWYGDYPSERQVNPTGPSSGQARVLRGGSYESKPAVVRSAFRYRYSPSVTFNFGFRCARDTL
ncbi:MAG: formylglycine-generating enzyme family protein [Chloroflexi bacterium]|nr:formylglycine-generating enzyme family protein [Chloroflexota bacterium]